MDDVCGVALSQPGPEGAGAGQGAGDLPLALVSLPLVLGAERCCLGIGGRGVGEDAVEGPAPRIDGDVDAGETGQQLLGVWLGEERSDVGLVLHGKGLVVAGYGDVEQPCQDPELGGEQPVDGGWRDVGAVADGVDSGGRVAAFEEEGPGGLDNCPTG